MNFGYAYLIGDAFFLVVWFVLFFLRPDLRKKMLVMSIFVAPFGFTQFFYFQDYWRPEYYFGMLPGKTGIEDILFCFLVGGVATVIYEEVFGLRWSKRHLKNHQYWMLAAGAFGLVGMFIGNIILKFNAMYVSVFLLLVVGAFMLLVRPDLFADALMSGILFSLLFLIFYISFFNIVFKGIIQSWWLLKNISGVLILGVPIEEVLWAQGGH
jgi:hypothetical protein